MSNLTPPNPLSSLFASDAGEAWSVADGGVDRILDAVRLHLGMEIAFASRFIDGRLPQLIHDASEFAAARELPITAALPIGSHLNVPLRLRDGRIYGTFCCISREPDRSLT